MLIGNIRLNQKNPIKWMGGIGSPQVRSNYNYTGAQANKVATASYSAAANGYLHPYTWQLPAHPGGMSSNFGVLGNSLFSGSPTAGMNIDAQIDCASDFQSIGSLIIDMVISITGSSSVDSSVYGTMSAAATVAASSSIACAVGAFAFALSTISGAAQMTASAGAIARIGADITPYTILSPESLSSAVWSAKAEDYTDTGSMGKKLNDAGGGSSPDDIAAAVWQDSSQTIPGTKGADLDSIKKNASLIPGLL